MLYYPIIHFLALLTAKQQSGERCFHRTSHWLGGPATLAGSPDYTCSGHGFDLA